MFLAFGIAKQLVCVLAITLTNHQRGLTYYCIDMLGCSWAKRLGTGPKHKVIVTSSYCLSYC